MIKGTYIRKHPILTGRTALLRPGYGPGNVLAQFDDLWLALKYTHGWRTYSVKSFKIIGYCLVIKALFKVNVADIDVTV